ncbi:hypothetical protein [Actinosynnema sp. NPDC020468]|uniref:hypothetical protein n=1 Tax=Actinosynnema sp. NPDC020468 TaxID=3154488 RepID=UPI0033CFEC1A
MTDGERTDVEHRVAAAFAAAARAVDVTRPAERPAPARRVPPPVGVAATVLLLCGSLLALVTVFGRQTDELRLPPAAVTTTRPPLAVIDPFELHTHCGIRETRIGDRYYEADPVLDDGAGNPPSGWANPSQVGVMTVTGETEAVFTDAAGHTARFRLRPGATAFLRLCE